MSAVLCCALQLPSTGLGCLVFGMAVNHWQCRSVHVNLYFCVLALVPLRQDVRAPLGSPQGHLSSCIQCDGSVKIFTVGVGCARN